MINLLRAGAPIQNFFSAVSTVKETNFTAYLAYLISIFPGFLGSLFLNNREKLNEVRIEQFTSDKERFDVVLDTNQRVIVIEAKLGFEQSQGQITRYLRLLKTFKKPVTLFLLDYGSFKTNTWIKEVKAISRRVEIRFITWTEIYIKLRKLHRYKKEKAKYPTAFYIASELAKYMEENQMVNHKRKEIYVRDLKGDSIELFFKYRIYKCQKNFYNSAQGNGYFAPYFTRHVPKEFSERSMIKIEEGISWMAPIKDVQQIKRNEVEEYLRVNGHPKYKEATKEIYREHKSGELLVFLLGDPFLVFLTPISKKKLNVHGAMGARSLTFQELFEAAGKSA